MEAYDLSRKLAYVGRFSSVPFVTGPEYTNSVPGVPVLSSVRIFLQPKDWSRDNVLTVSREICRVLGPTEQFDIGITLEHNEYSPTSPASGTTARLSKLNPGDPNVFLRLRGDTGDELYRARFPKLQFEDAGEDYWRSVYAPGAIKPSAEQ